MTRHDPSRESSYEGGGASRKKKKKKKTSLAPSLLVAQWLISLIAQRLDHPTSVREVLGLIPIGDSDFLLSHTREN